MTREEFIRQKTLEAQLRGKFKENAHLLEFLSADQVFKIWKEKVGPTSAEKALTGVKDFEAASNYVPVILDSVLLGKIASDLGISGRIQSKFVQGKQYIIVKGNAGNRSLLKGTRYLANNLKIVNLAITQKGINNSLISGARLTLIIAIPINALKACLEDEAKLAHFIGETASDVVKLGIASMISSITVWILYSNAIAAGASIVATGPFAVAILAGVLAGLGLNYLDETFHITDKLINALAEIPTKLKEVDRKAIRFVNKFNEHLDWQYETGQDVGRGLFY